MRMPTLSRTLLLAGAVALTGLAGVALVKAALMLLSATVVAWAGWAVGAIGMVLNVWH